MRELLGRDDANATPNEEYDAALLYICVLCEVSESTIHDYGRADDVAIVSRWLLWLILRDHHGWTFARIGSYCNRDRTTVRHGVAAVCERINTNNAYAEIYDTIRRDYYEQD